MYCSFCNKVFKNSSSLASHKYRYHKESSNILEPQLKQAIEKDLLAFQVVSAVNKQNIEDLKSAVRELRGMLKDLSAPDNDSNKNILRQSTPPVDNPYTSL